MCLFHIVYDYSKAFGGSCRYNDFCRGFAKGGKIVRNEPIFLVSITLCDVLCIRKFFCSSNILDTASQWSSYNVCPIRKVRNDDEFSCWHLSWCHRFLFFRSWKRQRRYPWVIWVQKGSHKYVTGSTVANIIDSSVARMPFKRVSDSDIVDFCCDDAFENCTVIFILVCRKSWLSFYS